MFYTMTKSYYNFVDTTDIIKMYKINFLGKQMKKEFKWLSVDFLSKKNKLQILCTVFLCSDLFLDFSETRLVKAHFHALFNNGSY